MRPSLAVAMIVRNEARDMPCALVSVKTVADYIVVIDTGSTDSTVEIAREHGAIVRTYLGASEQDENGAWRITDFSKARNESLSEAQATGATHVMWLDGDDELLDPWAVRRALYRGDVDTFGMQVISDGQAWVHQRLWRMSAGVRFKGMCHEYPIIDGLRNELLNARIKHHNDPDASQENANARNLRILMREWEQEPNERTAFYIANTHRDGKRWEEAIEWYLKRLKYGPSKFRDEWLFARLYMARSFRSLEQLDWADAELSAGQADAPDWCEFTMERAMLAYDEKRYGRAAAHALKCVDAKIPETLLWREPHCYRDGPCRLISWCYEHLGKIGKSALWAVLAQDRIGNPDAEWDARVTELKARVLRPKPKQLSAPAIVTRRKERIALVRPGAIGDVLMTLNLLPAFKEANPDAEVDYYTQVEGLDEIIRQSGANPFRDPLKRRYDRIINLVGYPLAEGYPNHPMADHLLRYFSEEMGLHHLNIWYGALPALELPLPAIPYPFLQDKPYATFQMTAGWSRYKEWKRERWDAVIDSIEASGVRAVEINQRNSPKLADAISLIANARMHLGVDSFGNHLTNYFWKDGNRSRRVPGVILWGSTQMEAAGYPTNLNIGHRLPCGPCFREDPKISAMPRGLCVDPPGQTRHDEGVHACMASITVDEVVEAALKVWESAK